MTVLFDIATPAMPFSPTTLGQTVLRRFEDDPGSLAIAVVDENGAPVGLIERNDFMVRMAGQFGHALWSKRSVSEWMNPNPLIADGETTAEAFCGQALRDGGAALLNGFIVTRNGKYAGVGAMLGLLQASAEQSAARAADMARLADAANASSRAAHEALSAKTRFLAVMSHEIRTPLNGVLGVAEIARRKATEPELRILLDTIVESGEVLVRLLNDALDLSRAEASSLDLDLAPVRASRLLAETGLLWTSQAELRGLHLNCIYEGAADTWILSDGVRLRQVLNNLVGNALKFTVSGGVTVRLSVITNSGQTRLVGTVTDSGVGIPADRLMSIFEPFSQTEEGLRRGGAGLGLAVCNQIIRRMDGVIHAAPNPVGGSIFSFETPVAIVDCPEKDMTEPSERLVTTLDSPRVLIVDDNATNRLVARTFCEMFGCLTDTATNGQEAIDLAAVKAFDLILMDIMMPGMDGMEATRRIRSGSGTHAKAPIIALTANADPADVATYLACGMNGVLQKPIQAPKLMAAINAALQNPAHAQAEQTSFQVAC